MLVLHLSYKTWSKWPGVVGKTTEFSNLPPAPNFRDTVSPRVALEWTTSNGRTDASLRGGYAYEMTPAPPARMAQLRDHEGAPLVEAGEPVFGEIRYLDSDRHVLTLGAGFDHDFGVAHVVFDIYGQLHVVTSRRHRIPTNGGTVNMRHEGLIPAFGWTAGLAW